MQNLASRKNHHGYTESTARQSRNQKIYHQDTKACCAGCTKDTKPSPMFLAKSGNPMRGGGALIAHKTRVWRRLRVAPRFGASSLREPGFPRMGRRPLTLFLVFLVSWWLSFQQLAYICTSTSSRKNQKLKVSSTKDHSIFFASFVFFCGHCFFLLQAYQSLPLSKPFCLEAISRCRSRARSMSRVMSSVYEMPTDSMSWGYMEMLVKPGIRLISLR
jgi:hypothetical protein